MTTIRIQKHLESATITLPELGPLVGKDVEIIVRERVPVRKRDRSAFFEAAKNVPIDLDAVLEWREASRI